MTSRSTISCNSSSNSSSRGVAGTAREGRGGGAASAARTPRRRLSRFTPLAPDRSHRRRRTACTGGRRTTKDSPRCARRAAGRVAAAWIARSATAPRRCGTRAGVVTRPGRPFRRRSGSSARRRRLQCNSNACGGGRTASLRMTSASSGSRRLAVVSATAASTASTIRAATGAGAADGTFRAPEASFRLAGRTNRRSAAQRRGGARRARAPQVARITGRATAASARFGRWSPRVKSSSTLATPVPVRIRARGATRTVSKRRCAPPVRFRCQWLATAARLMCTRGARLRRGSKSGSRRSKSGSRRSKTGQRAKRKTCRERCGNLRPAAQPRLTPSTAPACRCRSGTAP